jgi:Fic family protein
MDAYEKTRTFWKSKDTKTEAGIDLALDNFCILFAYHSGKIENDEIEYHDTRDIFENGKVAAFTGSTRALFEQQNQKLCCDFLRGKIASREPLSTTLIREVHGILTAGTYDERRFVVNNERPGEFKKHDYVIGRNEVGFPPDEVERALSELVDELNVYDGSGALKATAYFHVRFENIHPFADGNGRVGRTLMNFWLMTHNEPPLIIYEEDRKQYYAALESYDTNEEIAPMETFLREEAVKTWAKSIKLSAGERQKNESLYPI